MINVTIHFSLTILGCFSHLWTISEDKPKTCKKNEKTQQKMFWSCTASSVGIFRLMPHFIAIAIFRCREDFKST